MTCLWVRFPLALLLQTSDSQVVELAGTDAQDWSAQRSECPAGCGFRVQLSPWLLSTLSSETTMRVSQAHPGLISLDRRVRPPNPLLHSAGYANWQSDEVESLVTLWVRLPPRS